MGRFKVGNGDWTKFRLLGSYIEVEGYHPNGEDDGLSYWERMERTYTWALKNLIKAQEYDVEFVIFTHGWSTSGLGKTTHRSQIRKLMRGKDASPYITRKNCIQHDSVFVAAIRPKKG